MALYYDVEEVQKSRWRCLMYFVLQLKQKILLRFSRRLEYIKEYATIEYRFMEHISVEIDVDEDVMQNTIISLFAL